MKWNIGLKTARRKIQATTRLCPRNTPDITLNRRNQLNNRIIKYKNLATDMFCDTMFASIRAGKSVRNFTCSQVFALYLVLTRVNSLDFERDNHLASTKISNEIRIPNDRIMD